MEAFQLQDSLLCLPGWQPVIAGFTTKLIGDLGFRTDIDDQTVVHLREQLAATIKQPLNTWVFAQQTHSTNIRKITAADRGRGALQYEDGIPDTDGFYTNIPGIVLATIHADCTPVWFYAPKHKMIGVAHAGWRGTTGEITRKILKIWIEKENIPPADIRVAIGPCISQSYYEVGNDVIEQIKSMETPESMDFVRQIAPDKYTIDTRMLNYNQATDIGIPSANIQISNYCTFADSELFYSYRREHKAAGRMLAFITIPE
ncbi:peptidoglycan editing factor PgeF [Culicoidibacter larvae]|uniref:Purine nucleoside phosphorylase n=1 Tax=Culicoidibacter larvae TaxID=2579976 RepID=A0A5R8QB55_9FIRM|nr:peptidoglycan editing factor PgeF [Culicoidibacter larvae]TLG72548.1 peptidoglycan editing factor PgeF [Culicoidibacter larvae]